MKWNPGDGELPSGSNGDGTRGASEVSWVELQLPLLLQSVLQRSAHHQVHFRLPWETDSHSHSSGSFLWRKTWQLKWVDKVASPEQQEMILIGIFLQATEAWAEMLAEAKLLQVKEFSLNLKITWLTCFKSCRPFGLFLYFVQRSVGLKRSWRCASQRFARSIIVFSIWPPTPPEYFTKQNSTSGR